MPKTNNESLPDHKIRDCIEEKRVPSERSRRGKDRDSPILAGSEVGGQLLVAQL